MRNKILISFLAFLSIMSYVTAQKHYIVFVNGYRGLKLNHYTADGRIINPNIKFTVPEDSNYKSDAWIIGYWNPKNLHFDDSVLLRYKNVIPLYIDGHHPIKTSIHRNKFHLILSYLKSKIFFFVRNPKWILLRKANYKGFNNRIETGKIAGENFIRHYSSDQNAKITVVCHSMGFAVALGFCEKIKERVKFEDLIVLSPEGANLAAFDWNLFHHVWHYSPSWNKGKYRMIYLQDGIAPQVPISGLNSNEFRGIVEIPEEAVNVKLGFFKSHHLSFYQWFFSIKNGDRGYFGDY